MGEEEIEIITERKVLVVQQSFLRGGADRVEVDVCVTCGSVFDVILHDEWHRAQHPTRWAEKQ